MDNNFLKTSPYYMRNLRADKRGFRKNTYSCNSFEEKRNQRRLAKLSYSTKVEKEETLYIYIATKFCNELVET